jgi:hypothetical protein
LSPQYGIFDEKEDKELGINSKNIIRAYLEEKKILDGHDYEDYYMGSEKEQETFIELGYLVLRDRNVRLTTKIRHLRFRIWNLMFQKVVPMLERYWWYSGDESYCDIIDKARLGLTAGDYAQKDARKEEMLKKYVISAKSYPFEWVPIPRI